MTTNVQVTSLEAEPRPLTDLVVGDHGFLHGGTATEDRELLRALGLSESCSFRVCKIGDPFIVQVRSTRVAMSSAVAGQLLVIPRAEESE